MNNLLRNLFFVKKIDSQKVIIFNKKDITVYLVVLTPKSVKILFRFDAKTHIAPCISILSSPYESALEYP